jgi:hypothetical protein
MSDGTKYPFIDAAMAAEMMGIPQSEVLEWIEQGRLQRYGGKERNPFVRTTDVERVASELGRTLEQRKQTRSSQSPERRVQLRLRADSRWSDVASNDVAEWFKASDPASRAAGAKVARLAIERLNLLVALVDESETSPEN